VTRTATLKGTSKRPVGWRARDFASRPSPDAAAVLPRHRRLAALIARHATRRRLALIALVSVLLHALLVAVILLWPRLDPIEPPTDLPSPVAMVFEPPNAGQRALPTPSPTDLPTPPQAQRAEPAEALPLPPPPPPPATAPPTPPRQPDAAPARPITPAPPRAAPPRAAPSFPVPQSYSFGQPAPPGSAMTGEASFGQFAKLTAGHVEPSWMNALHEWWRRHGYYPSQAVALQQAGKVRIEIVVERSGKVRTVKLLGASDSPWLNMGAQDVFRGSTVPPFPPNTRDDQVTLELTINYIFNRR
jgi:protein TonB